MATSDHTIPTDPYHGAGQTADNLDLEVIVPAFNEQDRIGETLQALADQLQDLPFRSRLRVIDNGSTDRTAETVDDVNAGHHDIDIVIEGCSTRGKGSAVARGILTSSAKWVGFADADLATPASAIVDACAYLSAGWPVVIGSRHLEASRLVVDQPFYRRAAGAAFRLLTRSMTADLEFSDTQCGFKFFERSVAQDIFSRTVLAGFAFDVEVLILAVGLGYPVKEFPVEWTDREGSTFHPLHDGFEVARDLWRIRQMRQSVGERV
jgi:dolichyl-phosphate beta-glucosyltransferase